MKTRRDHLSVVFLQAGDLFKRYDFFYHGTPNWIHNSFELLVFFLNTRTPTTILEYQKCFIETTSLNDITQKIHDYHLVCENARFMEFVLISPWRWTLIKLP